jgi:hypothetical protein
MKPVRRQELRTNQLSQQLGQIGAYIKKNKVTAAVMLVGVVAVVGGAYWRVHLRHRRVDDGWATLNRAAALVDEGSPISVFESIAEQELNPALTAEAWLKVGDVAMARLRESEDPSAESAQSGSAAETDWLAKARTAYTEVVTRCPDDLAASGKAMVLLGVLAENEDDSAQARKWYEEIVGNGRFEGTPFLAQASYRLDNLERWSEPVTFAAPEPAAPLLPLSDVQDPLLPEPAINLRPVEPPFLDAAAPAEVEATVEPGDDATAPPDRPSDQAAPARTDGSAAADAETPPTPAPQQEPPSGEPVDVETPEAPEATTAPAEKPTGG